ncbi:MAG: HAD family phosphatase [Candidatus Aenigmatarchaeota archaeon]
MKSVIFDMDGVLFLTERLGYTTGREVCRKHGMDLTMEEYNKFMAGKRTYDAARTYLENKKADTTIAHVMVEEFRKMKRDVLKNRLKEEIVMRDGTIEMLERLRPKYRIALATSSVKEFALCILKGFGILDFFEVKLFAEDVNRGKPDPEIYCKTLQRLGLDSSECVVVEDSVNGINAAKAAGIKCIGIKSPEFNRNIKVADVVIDGFGDLTPAFIEGLGKKTL